MNLSPDQQNALLDLARAAIKAALLRECGPPLPIDPDLQQLAGCFVSLHETRDHRLRGCVGRLDAKASLAETVLAMAQAVLEDPRFLTNPVTIGELFDLDIELSILSPLIPAPSPMEFDLINDGIYLTYGERSGCFLPQVTVWRHPDTRLYRFTTLLIGPKPFIKSEMGTI